jgi:magnesium and cobalt transporter
MRPPRWNNKNATFLPFWAILIPISDERKKTMSIPGLFERLSSLLLREPEDREQVLLLLHSAFERNLMDADALSIIEGALAASETRVTDVLIPRAQMDVIDIRAPRSEILPIVLETAHSRFPVVDGDRDNVQGILLAKDLLRMQVEPEFNLRDWLRPAVFIPESKRLNVLLREFRVSRNHMAIVVDEYGGVAGLVTIEDVLEQIVGDIEDEYDFDEAHDNIRQDAAGRYRVKAQTEIEDFNAAFGTRFSDEDCDTIGGLILRHLGRVPRRNEQVDIGDLRFLVLRADSRRLYTLVVDRLPQNAAADTHAATRGAPQTPDDAIS